MMRFYKIKFGLLNMVLAFIFANGQNQNPYSLVLLKSKLQKTTVDTTKINILNEIASSFKYSEAKEGLPLAEKTKLSRL